jgi:photosystem II stability/assembly factor-like uncharacterized protein
MNKLTQSTACLSVLAALLLAPLGTFAQESETSDPDIEIIRRGIPHDALFALEMSGQWGLAVGNFGLMLETQDGGKTWEVQKPLTELALLGIKRAGEHQIMVGQQGLILTRSGDGEWQQVQSGFTQRLLNVGMNDAGLAFVVGEFGFIGRSRDFGATWEPVTTIAWSDYNDEGYEPHLYDAIVTPEGAVMVSGEFGLILRSEDGGETWRAVAQGDQSVFAMHLANDGSNTGYAVGQEGLILKTNDNGLSWTKLEAGSNANLLGIWSGNGEVVAVGIREMLRSSDDGVTFSASDDLSIVRTWYQGVAAGVAETKAGEKGFLRQQNVFIAGHRGTIARVLK